MSNDITVVSISGTYPSKRLQYEQFSYYGFEVLFDFAAYLKKNTDYQIEALTSGPESGKGVNGYVIAGKSSAGSTLTLQVLRQANFLNFCSLFKL